MTEKIFYTDPHISSFEATVLSCEETKNGYALILDRTAFFPEEGGQCCDRGTINGTEVEHVSIRQDTITHLVKTRFSKGDTVHGEIDYGLRFDNEQQHSGEHILSGLAAKLYGCTNVGFRLAEDVTTLDLDRPLTAEQINVLELQANLVVFKDLPVSCSFPSAEVLRNLDYRSKLDLAENVRIVEIPGVDVCACCAPHVDSTGMIGSIKIIKHEAWKGGVRLTILCGSRALKAFGEYLEILNDLSKQCSAGFYALPAAVLELKTKLEKTRSEKNLTETLYLEGVLKDGIFPAFVPPLDTRNIRNAINRSGLASENMCAVFSGENNDYNFMIASEKGGCKAISDKLRSSLDAKCGGSDTMVQGSVRASAKAIRDLLL